MRQLLKAKDAFKIRFTVALSGKGKSPSITHHTDTLTPPKPKKH